ncbi:efflux RND transporter periplasmic adaptor subunit [Nitrospirillum pindoramense]|uniref:Multidrug efflux system membrane fusion protein n=1 Tax=Nitrospirillum amazonense TaxID=28077 RepID=A0A560HCS5_9PROT|nr:efflux RND transporter periplasmic adaptor subunit [Nitrospirillum amazonense]TWB44166.1 multidrug efflux system membrane fusion protein [Nitrospirillum amazonense]
MNRRLAAVALSVVLVGAYGGYRMWTKPVDGRAAPAKAAGARGGDAPVPVATARVVRGPMPVDVPAVGTVQPIATVQVRARIDSQLMAAKVEEGQEVKAGDLLFLLDQRPPRAALMQAEANLARDQANLAQARSDAKRTAGLFARGAVSLQQNEQTLATAKAMEATVLADQAAVDQARLILSFTEIRSPIDGVVGAIQLRPGNLVKGSDSGSTLTTLVQVAPINVTFTVPERHVTAVRQALRGNRTVSAPQVSAPLVSARTTDGLVNATGRLVFVDNSVDAQSGTIQLKALYDNQDRALWPGQFVDVTLHLGIEADVLSVPAVAVQRGQAGPYVFVVKPDDTVEMRAVTVARFAQQGAEQGAVIASGVDAGERVVTEGQLRLVPGAKVTERPPVQGAPLHGGGAEGGGVEADGAKSSAASPSATIGAGAAQVSGKART